MTHPTILPAALLLSLSVLAQSPAPAPDLTNAAEPASLSTISGADLIDLIRANGLDPEQCYFVRDLSLRKDDIRLYFNEGYLIFSKPVAGHRLSAMFAGLDETADGEIILLPPDRAERESLAKFTGTPNLDEHFTTALLTFTDTTGDELLSSIVQGGRGRRISGAGTSMIQRFGSVVANITNSLLPRLTTDLLSPNRSGGGLLYITMTGKRLGTLDVIHDPLAEDSVLAGQMKQRDGDTVFDVWTGFADRAIRTSEQERVPLPYSLSDFKIQATIDQDLFLEATTRATLRLADTERVFSFGLSRAEAVTEVRIDGQPVELLAEESERRRAMRADENDVFLVVSPEPLLAGSEHSIEFDHQGLVIRRHGGNVYSVDARSGWYPLAGLNYTTYDLEFRYPEELTLVTPGVIAEDRVEEGWRITRRVTETPIRIAGFNLGRYSGVHREHGEISVDVYGNRGLETALVPRMRRSIITQRLPQFSFGGAERTWTIDSTPTPPDPLARLEQVAADVTASLEFFSDRFGPPALNTLTVSPVPGTSGQGFPGLIYLSTLSYLEPEARPDRIQNDREEAFYSELMVAHEVAHQWWGNVVAGRGYRDEWIMEALAHYSALLWIEHTQGPEAMQARLEEFRQDLRKSVTGEPLEAFGPVSWGYRLGASENEATPRVITYEKGAWIFHMLRQRLGDDSFFALLRSLRDRFQYDHVSTGELRALAKEFLPEGMRSGQIDLFFENWIHSTGMPRLSVSSRTEQGDAGVVVTGSLQQDDVAEGFAVEVPIEIELPSGQVQTVWVETGEDPETFTLTVPVTPVRVALRSGSVLHSN